MNDTQNTQILQEMLQLLELEKVEENIYRGQSQGLGFGSVFGGQALAQALSAAYRSVQDGRVIHSFHAYFLRLGDSSKPIVYNVDCIRDGKSFTTRRVVAIQNGEAIFNMSASFQIEEPGFDHQVMAPIVPGPSGIETELELADKAADKIPPALREKVLCRKPIEIRPVNPVNPFDPQKTEPVFYAWFKAVDTLPEDLAVHHCMLAYATDFGLASASLFPHGHTYWDPKMQVASLDHGMWIHRRFRMDEWMLYATESPNASNARGLNLGRIYTRQGKLVATVIQEGLIRHRD